MALKTTVLLSVLSGLGWGVTRPGLMSRIVLVYWQPRTTQVMQESKNCNQWLFGDCLDLINAFRSYQFCKNFPAALSMIHKGCLLDYDVDYQCEVRILSYHAGLDNVVRLGDRVVLI